MSQNNNLDSKDSFRTGCRNVSHKQQSFSGLQSARRSFSMKVILVSWALLSWNSLHFKGWTRTPSKWSSMIANWNLQTPPDYMQHKMFWCPCITKSSCMLNTLFCIEKLGNTWRGSVICHGQQIWLPLLHNLQHHEVFVGHFNLNIEG